MRWLAKLASFFHRNERELFRYWDGIKRRSIDPLQAHRAIWNDQACNLLEDSRRSANPKKDDGSPFYPIEDVFAAEDRIRVLTRRVFGVAEWTETTPGLTLLETDNLLESFIVYCDDLKKKHAPSPTAQPPMESTAPLPSWVTAALSGSPAFPDGLGSASSCSPTESTGAVPIG